jgi:YD repeat-containing protein
LSSKIGNVVRSQVITIDPSEWTDASPHEARINIIVPIGTERRSTVLLIPKNKETRDESQAIELTVKTLWTADKAMSILITMKRQDTNPPTIPLSYLALVIYDEEAADDSTATAEFVGVVNLPDELMEREVKRALEVLGVTEDLITTMGDVDAVQKDISAAKISIEMAKDNIAEAKQDIDQAKQDIDQAKTDIEKMVSVESVTVSKAMWTGAKSTQVTLSGAADPDTVFFFFPADEPTKTAATKARMTIMTFVSSMPSYGILGVTLKVEDESFVKETDLTFTVLRVRENGATARRAVLVGVDSYGDIVPTSIDLSGLDDGEVVETFSDGTTKTTTIEYDADGNPVKITDGDGNVTVLTW